MESSKLYVDSLVQRWKKRLVGLLWCLMDITGFLRYLNLIILKGAHKVFSNVWFRHLFHI